jgi:hypothetical protein
MPPKLLQRTNTTHHTMLPATFEALEQHAKARGAAAGLHSVDDDFTASVEARLDCLFIAQYGDLGPEPELVLKQRAVREEELEQVMARLCAHQNDRFVAMEHVRVPTPFNLRLGIGMTLCCGLGGLVASAAGVPMPWQGWAMLGVLAGLLTLLVQALPHWARNVRYYLTLYALRRRVKRLERTITRLNATAWRELELRSQREQFIAPRKQLLVSIFEYYKAAGACTAQQQQQHQLHVA